MLFRCSLFLAVCLAVPTAASAQLKEPASPALTPYTRSLPPPPSPSYAPPVHPTENNPQVEALADRLPLAPSVKAIRNQEPPDPKGVERQLGLHEPKGVRVNLEGRTPSKQEILNAFQNK
jgi:hypothetical protein